MNMNETEAMQPCAGGCGHYGSQENNNLCSLCFKKCVFQQFVTLKLEPETEPEPPRFSPPTSSPVAREVHVEGTKPRCEVCHRKTGIIGFKCRCGHLYCGSHRYPEAHCCTFDYKQSGRIALARELPLVRRDRLQRF